MEGVPQVADPKYILEGCHLRDTCPSLNPLQFWASSWNIPHFPQLPLFKSPPHLKDGVISSVQPLPFE
jgi:hypothetical protein